jgi:catechol 2,3-dioxygenase-like lactoylglutathione lyase family enzyme
MRPRITVLTLGVDHLERSLRFYRELGFASEGIVGTEFEHGAVAFFDLQDGIKLALWRRDDLAHDSGLGSGHRQAAGEDLLWWVRRLFSGSGRTPVGSPLQPRPGSAGLMEYSKWT